jgi:hypothetical protein
MPDAHNRVRRKLFWMFAIAFALRLVVMAYLYPLQISPGRDHWDFGYETGRIARSIATGRGFGSPLFADTGPTAWMTPVYPYIVAGVFKVFGVFTKASALVILSLNALTSALTCLPIFFFTRKSFGERAGWWAGWAWAIFPYAVYWPVERIWDSWLATLLLAILFWIALYLAESTRLRDWIGFGLLAGVAALTDPVVLAPLPFLALWALWRLFKVRRLWHAILPAMTAVLAVILVVSPWFIRNYCVFHRFIPFRDVFPLALRVGNVGDQFDMVTLQMGPWASDEQWQEFQKEGEILYMQNTSRVAMQYIRAHRREYDFSVARRIIYVWTKFWYLIPSSRYGYEPNPADIFIYTSLTILALLGVLEGFPKGFAIRAPYAIVLFLFPVVYYFTSLEPWYSAPMDPFLISLAASAVAFVDRNGRPSFLLRFARREAHEQT